jgi:hypothetical protein
MMKKEEMYKGGFMITPVKDRQLVKGQIVQVYRNLNRDCFSIRDKKTGLVVAYCNTATIQNAKFVVSATGHARVLKTGVRSVHAYIEGAFLSAGEEKKEHYQRGYYNPFKTDQFIHEDTGEPIEFAKIAHCQDTRVYFSV